MSKKHSIDFIRSEVCKENYTLLSNVYINSQDKLDLLCPVGHRYSSSWSTWRHGSRCPHCTGLAKKNIDEVKTSFENEDYILISKDYKNCKTKLHYMCKNGHLNTITWTSWQQGKRCPECSVNARKEYEFVKNLFEAEGCVLIDSVYINNKQKLNYKCANGHKHSIRINDWLSGHRCYHCFGNKRTDIDLIKNEFAKEGYTLKTLVYNNAYTKLSYSCSLGHHGTTNWQNWKKGARCSTCHKINITGSGNPSWKGGISYEPYCQNWTKEFKEFIKERDGFKCLNPSCTSKNPLDLTIHHIDYDKKNCSPSNLITVCRSCNAKANKDRRWHKTWYQAILNIRYNYNH